MLPALLLAALAKSTFGDATDIYAIKIITFNRHFLNLTTLG
jgi:hypothetical protein